MTTSHTQRIRDELRNRVVVPKTLSSKMRPTALCCWLTKLQDVLSTLLTELKTSVTADPSGTPNYIQTQKFQAESESHITLQINLTIRQLFPELFILALTAHARQAFKKWLQFPECDRLLSVAKEFQICKKFTWTVLYRQKYIDMLHETIDERVEKLCKGEHQTEFLPDLREYIDTTILPFAQEILCRDLGISVLSSTVSENEEVLKLRNLLHKSLLHALSKSRAKELFEIVADFPDSILAIKELKEAANASSCMPFIGKVFRAAICRRLLHSGASTNQILEMYIAMIRALRILDPSDLVLNFIAAPVRTYLMSRRDTVRCIVSSFTKNKDSDLHDELKKGGSLVYGADEDDEAKGPGDFWEPRKRDPDLTESGFRGLDVLALLVSIYGSTDLFVTEYRALLADKLLSNLLYDTDLELATLELLKMRFGEEPLHSCEVMLRDIEESKRVNNAIAFELKKNNHEIASNVTPQYRNIEMDALAVDCVMISDNYWPPLLSDSFTHHPEAIRAISSYQDAYTNLKKPRKLHLSPQLGVVELELEFQDGSSRSFLASPVQASLIMHITEKENGDDTSLTELCEKCEVEKEVVQNQMTYWISKGVVKEKRMFSRDCEKAGQLQVEVVGEICVFYTVIEEQAENALRDLEVIPQGTEDTDEDTGQGGIGHKAGVSSDVIEKASFLVFEKYIRGMLSSHDSMTVERLHSLLRLISQGTEGQEAKFDMNIVQLKRFLQTLIDENKLELIDNAYRLRK